MSDGVTDISFGGLIIVVNVVLAVLGGGLRVFSFIAVVCGMFLVFNGIRLIK